MKAEISRFLKKIFLFSLPFWAGLGWILWREYPEWRRYHAVMKDCRSGDWIYHRLYERPTPIEVAFVGTSRTMCAVNDSVVEFLVRTGHSQPLNIANLGVCRRGPNLHYLVAEDAIRMKHPKLMVLEVGATLDGESHHHFPMMAGLGDLVAAPLRPDYVTDLGLGVWERLVYAREEGLGIQRKWEGLDTAQYHSFQVVARDMVAPQAEMEKSKKKNSVLEELPPSGVKGLWYDLEKGPSRTYYQMIGDLCKENGVRLVFLYLPTYGTNLTKPQEFSFLEEMGEIWTPPDSVLGNAAWYFDIHHLNQVGARKLAPWLAEKIADADVK